MDAPWVSLGFSYVMEFYCVYQISDNSRIVCVLFQKERYWTIKFIWKNKKKSLPTYPIFFRHVTGTAPIIFLGLIGRGIM